MIKKGLLVLVMLLGSIVSSNAQWNMGKVKNILGGKKEPSKLDNHIQQLKGFSRSNRSTGSEAEMETANYLGEQFRSLLYKPYLGQYVHRFAIDKKNNLSTDSYVKVFNKKLSVGTDVIVPPFSGTGTFSAQALPGMQEADNLWFIKFSEVGEELNNKHGNGLEKLYRKAKEAFENGAESVMFINDDGAKSDFSNSFNEKKILLPKPVFILNHAAYIKHIVEEGKGKEWIDVDYDFSKTRRTTEGHNAVGYWQNQTPLTVVVVARLDQSRDKEDNISGMAALLEVAERINKMRLKNYNYIVVALSGTDDDYKGAESFIKRFRLSKDNVSCVVHIDDVGALNNRNELFLSGLGTSPDWEMLIGSFTRNFMVQQINSGEVGEENHRAFYDRQIPVLNIFTKRQEGNKRLNKEGVANIALSIGDLLMEVDNVPKLKFSKTKPLPNFKKQNFKANMGILPDYAHAGDGLLIGVVRERSPAAFSGVLPGDVLVKMEDYDIHNIDDYIRELSKYKKGDRLMIKVKRKDVDKQMLITFK